MQRKEEMKKIHDQLTALESAVAALKITDLAGADDKEVQALSTRIMRLSGQLNHLAYQLLFTREPDQNRNHEAAE